MLKKIGHIISSLINSSEERDDDFETIDNLTASNVLPEDLAYAALLVDLSKTDGHFDQREERVIRTALHRLFPESVNHIDELISTGVHLSNNFRGPNTLIEKIKQEYSPAERESIYGLIDGVVAADTVADPVETYFKNKLKALLN